jgi:hypothetical protein
LAPKTRKNRELGGRTSQVTVNMRNKSYNSLDMIHICDENDDNEDGFGQNWKVVVRVSIWVALIQKGTSMELEKPYVRLTREPDPSMIRPESVLKQSLEMILDKWKKEEVTTGYVLEQFRSIRQVPMHKRE